MSIKLNLGCGDKKLDGFVKILSYNYILDPIYIDKLNKGEIKQQDLPFLMRANNNVCSQINIEWLCVK